MRITSGLLKSRTIKNPKNIRPTQDKVRKGLFDTIRAKVVDSYFLELFAGSGAVGIEALSNGASEVVFVEKDKRCCKIIEDNLAKLGLIPRKKDPGKNIFTPLENRFLTGSILTTDALRAIEIFYKNNKKFDIIFLDPPYYPKCSYSKEHLFPECSNFLGYSSGSRRDTTKNSIIRDKNLAKKALQKLSACDILAPHGLIVAEHSKKDSLDDIICGLTCFKQKRYGDTILSFYRKKVSLQ
ncbi:MAG: RsmD family RNA methyltransferase [Candidatus Omnitrophica bacterium]|nr:RsmD family RNA methyltransferase [Candidatus Omnitrophota bacterium]